MTAFTATVACLHHVRAILGDVSDTIAFIARDGVRVSVTARIRAIARPMANLVALVASRIIRLGAVLGDVTDAIATVATLRLLRTSPGKVPQLIAFEALLTIATATHVAAPSSTTSHVTITGKMAGAVAPVARGRHRHFGQRTNSHTSQFPSRAIIQ